MGKTILVLARRYRAWGYFRSGCDAEQKGDHIRASLLYEKSLEWFPTAQTYTFLAWTSSVRGDLDSSIRFCKEAIKLDPESGAPYNDIGAYMIEMGALEGAIPWLVMAINSKRYDTYWFPWLNLGRVQERRGDWMGALEFVKASLRCRPNYVPALKALSRIRGRLN